jgi:LPXTG-motif cell wall-anchored protein
LSNFAIYIIGTILVGGGLVYAGYKIGISAEWLIVIGIIVLGFGIMGGVKRRKGNN